MISMCKKILGEIATMFPAIKVVVQQIVINSGVETRIDRLKMKFFESRVTLQCVHETRQ